MAASSRPLVFADIFSVLIRHYAAACCKRGLWQEKSLFVGSVMVPAVSAFSLATCKNIFSRGECRLMCVLLEYK